MTLVFLDTEFTDLDEPNLLSIGMVSDAGDELYVELELGTDDARDRMRVVSDFVRTGPVLTQWGLVPGAALPHKAMGRRAGEWIVGIAARVGGDVEVLSDCLLDFQLLEGALRHGGMLDEVHLIVRHDAIEYVMQRPRGQAAFVIELERVGRERGLQQHHALADALALKAAYVAVAK